MNNSKGNIMKTKELVSPSATICVPVKYLYQMLVEN